MQVKDGFFVIGYSHLHYQTMDCVLLPVLLYSGEASSLHQLVSGSVCWGRHVKNRYIAALCTDPGSSRPPWTTRTHRTSGPVGLRGMDDGRRHLLDQTGRCPGFSCYVLHVEELAWNTQLFSIRGVGFTPRLEDPHDLLEAEGRVGHRAEDQGHHLQDWSVMCIICNTTGL